MEKSVSPFDIMSVEPNIKVESLVFTVLQYFGIDVDDAASHFTEVVNKMRACPPNFRYRKTVKDGVWIVRDFFPGTNFMFKVTMVHHTPEQRAQYHNRVSGHKYGNTQPYTAQDFNHELWVNVKFIYGSKKYDKIKVRYAEGQKYAMAKTANILIGDDVKPDSFMYYGVKPMKRMFPKGYKAEELPKNRPAIFKQRPRKRKKKKIMTEV